MHHEMLTPEEVAIIVELAQTLGRLATEVAELVKQFKALEDKVLSLM